MDFSKLLHRYVKIETWISLSCYMDLSNLSHVYLDLLKLLEGFVKVDQNAKNVKFATFAILRQKCTNGLKWD